MKAIKSKARKFIKDAFSIISIFAIIASIAIVLYYDGTAGNINLTCLRNFIQCEIDNVYAGETKDDLSEILDASYSENSVYILYSEYTDFLNDTIFKRNYVKDIYSRDDAYDEYKKLEESVSMIDRCNPYIRNSILYRINDDVQNMISYDSDKYYDIAYEFLSNNIACVSILSSSKYRVIYDNWAVIYFVSFVIMVIAAVWFIGGNIKSFVRSIRQERM